MKPSMTPVGWRAWLSGRVRVPGRPEGIERRWALLALLAMLVLLVLVALLLRLGLSPSQPADTSAAEPSFPSTSAYAKLLSEVQPDGTVTKDVALQAFALAIAPLPGVTPPSGDPTPLYQRLDGTFAIDWLRPYLGDLTPAQTEAVNAALGISIPAPGAGATAARPAVPAQLASDNPYVDAVNAAEPVIAAKLGRPLNLSWSVVVDATQPEKAPTEYAITWASWIKGYGATGCTIHVHPLLANANDPAIVRATMAHELFHCFQYDWFDQHGGFRALPSWIMEGQAEWAGENVAGASNAGLAWWGTYLTSPEERLWQRTYDAVGFYQHMAEEGIDPWQHFDQMLATTDNVGAFQAAGANADTFEDTWASGFYRDPSLNDPPWNASGPWTLTARALPHQLSITIGDSKDLMANVVTDQDWTVSSYADVLEVRMQGHVRMRAEGAGNETDTAQRWLCTRAGGCACPAGEHFVGPDLETAAPVIEFGLTGGLDGASGTLVGHGLDEYCKPSPSPGPTAPPGNPCQTDCPDSNGDPHLRTSNDYRYDFQAAGEFVLLRSADGSIEVQARQEPFVSSTFPGVSINTAVAVRDGGHRVSVYAGDTGLALHVDGLVVDPAVRTDLGPGASVHPMTGGLEIDFPDGSILWTLSVGHWGINALLQPSDALRASGTGLLGPITPGGLGVPALPDGTQLPAAPDARTRDSIVYGRFADAWRVTDASSLFDYEAGRSTASYTDRAYPSDAQRQVLEALPASATGPAATACAALTDPDLQSDCVFDVAATGDDGFVQQYQVQQDLYDSGIAAATPTPVPSSGMVGALPVTTLTDIQGSAIGSDDTLYLSIDRSSGSPEIIAVDPRTGAVRGRIDTPRATDLYDVAGSIWAAGMVVDASGQACNVTRYDPATLAVQATFPIPCTSGYPGPRLVSSGTSVWFINTATWDLTTGTGARLTRIDPATDAPAQSVPLPLVDGCCQRAQGALFCYCGNSDFWRLVDGAGAFEDVGQYAGTFPTGTGFWVGQGFDAVYVSGPGEVSAPIPIQGQLVGGDAGDAYVEVLGQTLQLFRQPADGSPAVPIATAPVLDPGLDQTQFDYLTGSPLTFVTSDAFVSFWNVNGTGYVQWAATH